MNHIEVSIRLARQGVIKTLLKYLLFFHSVLQVYMFSAVLTLVKGVAPYSWIICYVMALRQDLSIALVALSATTTVFTMKMQELDVCN